MFQKTLVIRRSGLNEASWRHRHQGRKRLWGGFDLSPSEFFFAEKAQGGRTDSPAWN